MKSSPEKVMGHTEGKLTWGLLYISQPKNHGSYKQLAMHPSGVTQEEGGQWEYDARRLVACWNACVEVPTDTLERVGLNWGHIEAVKQERDELVKALRKVVEWNEKYPSNRVFPIAQSYVSLKKWTI